MIPPREQEALRTHFQHDLLSRVRLDFFRQEPSPIYIPGRQDCAYCDDVQELLQELASLSERIALTVHDFDKSKALAAELGVDKVPATVLRGQTNRPLRFFGVPFGNEWPGLVGTLLDASKGSVTLEPESVKQLRRLKSDVHLQILVTTTCRLSPLLARTAMKLGLQSVRVKVDVIEVSEYPALVQRYGVTAVPVTLIDDAPGIVGAMDEAPLVQQIMRVAEGRHALSSMPSGPSTPLIDPSTQTEAQTTTASGLIVPR